MLDLIARPFGILVMWLYELTNNYFLAVVLFALIVKLILLPFQMKSKKSMMRQSLLQPQLQEIAKKHGANKVKYNEEVQKLYKEEGINPMSGCLWSLIPFPILLALYLAIRKPITIMMGVAESLLEEGGAILNKLTELGFSGSANSAYIQIEQAKFISENFKEFEGLSPNLHQINYTCFGLDLGSTPNWKIWTYDWSSPSVWGPALGLFMIPVVAALLTWLSSKISMKTNPTAVSTDDAAASSTSGMMAVMPLMTLWFAFLMPAALGIYWIANSFFAIIQDVLLNKHYGKQLAAEMEERNAARAAKEAELEQKRKETERLREQNATSQNENTSKRKQQQKKKQAQSEKAAEWLKSNSGEEPSYEPSRVGNRRYARGRSYDPDRFAFNGVEGATGSVSEIDADLNDVQDLLNRAANAEPSPEGDAPELSEAADEPASTQNDPADNDGTDEIQGE
ncbi:MAG: membrane protein insertase YidC [Oscillospiraceae bacterium]